MPRPTETRRSARLGFVVLVTGLLAALSLTGGAAMVRPAHAQAGGEAQSVIHTWRRLYYGVLDGQTSLLFSDAFERSKPALGDLDGDGDLDLVVGTADGRLMYFQNQGSAKEPKFRLVNETLGAQRGAGVPRPEDPLVPISVGANAAPALVDIDSDGDLDLFVGSASGKLYFFRNTGNKYLPVFRLESTDFLGVSLGLNLVPKFADVNGDGLPDLLLGNEAGEVWLLSNQGTRQAPRFCARQEGAPPDCLRFPVKLLQLPDTDNAVPDLVDWGGDGLLDLMVGKSDGTLDYYQNIGTRAEPVWELRASRFDVLDIGSYSAPLFADISGDGRPDLLLAGDSEQMARYSNRPGEPRAQLWLEDRNALQVRRLGRYDSRARVATGDLFGNGRQDLVVGTASGQLLVYENLGGKDLPAFRSFPEAVLPGSPRAFSAPALVDVDGDGLLDLVVGDRNGRLEWIRNTGNKRSPQWRTMDLFFGQVDVGSLSVPFFADVDGDGLPDLLAGNGRGTVVLYRNTGSKQQPQYQLVNTRFGGVAAGASAAPALFAWNPKGEPDLIVGGQQGLLIPAVRNPGVAPLERGAFLAPGAPWSGLRAPSHSAPHFAALTEGKLDLLLGTGRGTLLVWQYEGTVTADKIAKAAPPGRNVVREESAAPPPSGDAAPGQEPPVEAASTAPPAAAPPEPVFVEEASEIGTLDAGRNTKPAFIDYNGDGRPDLVVGNHDGKLILFENLGPAENPKWRKVTESFADYRYGHNAAPVFADVRGDGRPDLLVGSEDGTVMYLENVGTAKQPRFLRRADALRRVRTGKNAVPALLDVNEDGVPELIVGTLRGSLLYYRRKTAKPLDFELIDRRFLGLDAGINASPVFTDLLGNKKPLLVVGSDRGQVRILEPTGTSRERTSGWKPNTVYLAGHKFPAGSHPAFVDLDGDGNLDLVMGSDQGRLTFYRNKAAARPR
jgi:hypothetical protein